MSIWKTRKLNALINLEQYKKEKFTILWIYLTVAFLLFVSGILLSVWFLKGIKNIQDDYNVHHIQPISVDMRRYSCPPQLTQEQCEKRVMFALQNGWDPEEMLLVAWNRLK